MKFRKLVSLSLASALLLGFTNSSFAWGGYAHWETARRTAVYRGLTDSTYQKFYKSGALFADIGRFAWDASGWTVSDSVKFADKMIQLSKSESYSNGSSAKYFAAGWRAHVQQDASIDLTKFRSKGWIDEYLRDELGIKCPINGTESYGLNYQLIRDTYSTLDGFSPTNAQIDQQIGFMYSLYNAQIAANFSGWTSAERTFINSEIDRVSKLCYINYSTTALSEENYSNIPHKYAIASSSSSMVGQVIRDMENEKIKKEKKDKVKEKVHKKLKEISEKKLVKMDKESTGLPDEYIITFTIEDMEKYNQAISEINDTISSEGYTVESLYEF